MFSLDILFFLVLISILASWNLLKELLFHSKIPTLKSSKQLNNPKLPPSPPKLPIIGHLHLVGKLPHRSFQTLAKNYGPIIHLKLGSKDVIVVSSPAIADRLLRAHDTKSANRPTSEVSYHLSYGHKGIVFSPYSPYWNNMRKLCVMEILSASKVRSFAWLREEEMSKLVSSIKQASVKNGKLDVGNVVGCVVENLIHRMLYGTPKEGFGLRPIALEGVRIAGTLNIADFLPFLAPFDIQGLKRSIKELMKDVDDFLEKIIKEHEDDAKTNQRTHKDLVDIMLSLLKNNNNPYDIERDNIKAILIDLVVPAIDSATNLIKWALSLLLKNPEKMTKLQEEIESVVSLKRMVEEKDLPKLKYLDIVIKETFRLFPIIFAPHEATDEIIFDGYYIPKGSQIFLNAWAIGRDPNIWSDDCEKFRPERFLVDDIDIVSGQDFRLAPFGFGRRRCPGAQFGLLNVKLLLSQLVHCFDWNMPDGMSLKDLIMQEKFGLVMSMANNLVLIPKYRLNV